MEITTCLLCGTNYPGPSYENHLLREHGVVFNMEYIIRVSQFKDKYATLPPIIPNIPTSSVEEFSETDDVCAPAQYGYRDSAEQEDGKPAGRFYFSQSQIERLHREYRMNKNPSIEWRLELAEEFQVPARKVHMWYGKRRQKDKLTQSESFRPVSLSSVPQSPCYGVPERSGFVYKCELCNFVTKDLGTFRSHVTKKHKQKFSKYRTQYGDGETCTGSGLFQCSLCQAVVKHLPRSVDKHLKNQHKINWVQYIDMVKKRLGEEHVREVDDDNSTDSMTMLGVGMQGIQIMEDDDSSKIVQETSGVTRRMPTNIKDKTTKYCSQCKISFVTRAKFLRHCQA